MTATSSQAPATVWERAAAPQQWPDWCRAVVVCDLDGPYQVGTHVRLVLAEVRPTEWTVSAITPGRAAVWTSSGPGFTAQWRLAVEQVSRGTAVRVTYSPAGPMAWAVVLIVRRPMRAALAHLARAVAGE